ncbi:type I secretion system permease/ATPase [uncultured Roseobacter sp.]|uniref:peptidase domain-containing ABC transporter n=1 Tax=uncultured Roseobacter sp. TaxID=114847 RepID=UPI002607A068|nr:type I secretion system permease/ATPase [uncultured Roseobacter sp.]
MLKVNDTPETVSDLIGCVLIWGRLLRVFTDPAQAEQAARDGIDLAERARFRAFAHATNLRGRFKRLRFKHLSKQPLPIVAKDVAGGWFILVAQNDTGLVIQRPHAAEPELLSPEALAPLWSGHVLLLAPKKRLIGYSEQFSLLWFWRELKQYKLLGAELLAASAALQLLALVTPLLFQAIFDKVLVHQSFSTLDVLVIVIVVVAIFEALLKGARDYLALHTATRVDARLGARLFGHLVHLPLSYFQSRPVGVTVSRVMELDQIRAFLTGAANTLLIDLTFSMLFFAVMWAYSPQLTLFVMASIPLYILIAVVIARPFLRRVEQLHRDAALNTSFLTEILTGTETVKSIAVEPKLQRRWEMQTRDLTRSNHAVQELTHLSSNLVSFVQKGVTVVVLWVGVGLVLDLELTIGELIAFNMMASHVSQPLVRLTELWREFLQARLGIERIADVLNTLPEVSEHKAAPARKGGDIELRGVDFSYQVEGPLALKNLSLHIPEGEMIAFVGASGSGKSTVTKLIQKLYVPHKGQVRFGGRDLAELDPTALRQQISVVPQESFLFARSVRDNIAVGHPAATFEQVQRAATLAGAHEFIVALSDGYDTEVAEGGVSLSGGQRQRISIARALMSDPAVLILDEATSALDEHSQAAIQANMAEIRQGRTVIVVAHRLSTVRDCDRIAVMDQGEVVELGSHDALLADPEGRYRRLWDLQVRALWGATPDKEIENG